MNIRINPMPPLKKYSESNLARAVLICETPLYHNDIAILSSFLKNEGIDNEVFFIETDDFLTKIAEFGADFAIVSSEYRAHGGVGETNDLLNNVIPFAFAISDQTGVSYLHIQDFTAGAALSTEQRDSINKSFGKDVEIAIFSPSVISAANS